MTRQKAIVIIAALNVFLSPARAQDTTNAPPRRPTPVQYINDDSKSSDNYPFHLTLELTAEHRRILNGDYDWFGGVALQGSGSVSKHDSAGMLLAAGGMRLRPGSRASNIATDPGVLQWGFFGRHSMTPIYTVIQPYISADVRFSWMEWSYRSPMLVEGKLVQSDGVEGMEATVGAGLLINLQYVTFFGEADVGGFFTLGQTDNGVDNDFLPAAGYIGVKIGAAIRF